MNGRPAGVTHVEFSGRYYHFYEDPTPRGGRRIIAQVYQPLTDEQIARIARALKNEPEPVPPAPPAHVFDLLRFRRKGGR